MISIAQRSSDHCARRYLWGYIDRYFFRGAAIEYREQLENNQSFDVDIDELGIYSANLVRRIDENVIAIQFSINEALAVRLAARIAVAYYEQQNSIGDGYELEEIEVLSVESVECA